MTPDEVRRTMLRPDLGPLDPPARAIYRGPDVLLGDGSQVLHSGDEVEFPPLRRAWMALRYRARWPLTCRDEDRRLHRAW